MFWRWRETVCGLIDELRRDLPVRSAGGNEAQHLQLSIGERGLPASCATTRATLQIGLGAELFERGAGCAAARPRRPRGRPAHGRRVRCQLGPVRLHTASRACASQRWLDGARSAHRRRRPGREARCQRRGRRWRAAAVHRRDRRTGPAPRWRPAPARRRLPRDGRRRRQPARRGGCGDRCRRACARRRRTQRRRHPPPAAAVRHRAPGPAQARLRRGRRATPPANSPRSRCSSPCW